MKRVWKLKPQNKDSFKSWSQSLRNEDLFLKWNLDERLKAEYRQARFNLFSFCFSDSENGFQESQLTDIEGILIRKTLYWNSDSNNWFKQGSLMRLKCENAWWRQVRMCRGLTGFSVHGKNTGAGCYFLLQGIFQTQGSITRVLRLLHWQVDSHCATWEVP